jgi:phi13 family phage major tail protein
MDKNHDEFVGVDSLHAAVVNVDTEAEYSADTPEYLAPAAEITGQAETENKTTYYDNMPANNYVTEGATTLNITVSGVPADLAAKYLGKKYDAATGRVYDSGNPNPPNVALSFRFNKGKDGYRYYQYLKGTFSGGAEEASSKSNTIDIKTYQMTFTAVTTTHKWTVDGALKALKRIFGDTTDDAFSEGNWFNAVQTPDTAVTPSALSLDSSVPAADATGVAVDSDITLTFDNKISDQVITLFSDAFAAVATTITKDSTGKILTVSPDSDLDAATSYNMIMTSITDIYGQKLENQVIEFATA